MIQQKQLSSKNSPEVKPINQDVIIDTSKTSQNLLFHQTSSVNLSPDSRFLNVYKSVNYPHFNENFCQGMNKEIKNINNFSKVPNKLCPENIKESFNKIKLTTFLHPRIKDERKSFNKNI